MRAYIKYLQTVSQFSLTRSGVHFLRLRRLPLGIVGAAAEQIDRVVWLLGHQIRQRYRVLGGGVAEGALADLLRVVVGLLDDAAVLDHGGLERLGLDEAIRVGLPHDFVGLLVDFDEGPESVDERVDEAVGHGLVCLVAEERSLVVVVLVHEALDGADLPKGSDSVVAVGEDLVDAVEECGQVRCHPEGAGDLGVLQLALLTERLRDLVVPEKGEVLLETLLLAAVGENRRRGVQNLVRSILYVLGL